MRVGDSGGDGGGWNGRSDFESSSGWVFRVSGSFGGAEVDIVVIGNRSKLSTIGGAGYRLPAAGAGGGLFGPSGAGVGGGVDRATNIFICF